MKGLILNAAEEAITGIFGEATWDALLVDSGCRGAYTSLGTYPDGELTRIVTAAERRTGLDRAELLVRIGRHGFDAIARRRPELLSERPDPEAVLRDLDSLIHPEVRAVDPAARPPSFRVLDDADGVLRLRYASPRALCRLAEGLVEGLGAWFGVALAVTHDDCVERGGSDCILAVRRAAATTTADPTVRP